MIVTGMVTAGMRVARGVLQENENDDEDQDAGLEQRVIHSADRVLDEDRGVVVDGVLEAFREILAQCSHFVPDSVGDLEGVGAGQRVDDNVGGFLAAEPAEVRVALLAQFDPADILDADHACTLATLARNDDVLKLLRIGEAAQGIDGELKYLAVRHRRAAQLTRDHRDVLLLDGLLNVENREIEGLQLFRIEPDPHAVRSGADDLDLPNPGNAAEGILQVDDSVVAEKGFVEPVVVGIEVDHLQDVGRHLADGDTLRLYRLGQL